MRTAVPRADVLGDGREEMARPVDHANFGFWNECDCRVCGGFVDLRAGLHIHSQRVGRDKDELARSSSKISGRGGIEHSKCISGVFGWSSGDLLGIAVVSVAKEDFFEGVAQPCAFSRLSGKPLSGMEGLQ